MPDSAAEMPKTDVSVPTLPQAGDGLGQQSASDDVVVDNSTSIISASTDNVRVPERGTPQREPVVPIVSGNQYPSGALLAELKRKRAQERQERMQQRHGNRSPNGNGIGVVTNGTIVNGVDNASPRLAIDNVTYLGTHHRYSNRYDITAPNERDKCCVVM